MRASMMIVVMLLTIGNVKATVPIGINMDGLVDWSNSMPYVNLVRQSRPWGSPSAPWDGNATFDPTTGWPTSDFGMILVSDASDPGGRYLVYAKGNASVKVPLRFDGHIENQTYDESTDTLSAIIFILQNATDITIGFTNTTGPGLQDISVLQLDYNVTSK